MSQKLHKKGQNIQQVLTGIMLIAGLLMAVFVVLGGFSTIFTPAIEATHRGQLAAVDDVVRNMREAVGKKRTTGIDVKLTGSDGAVQVYVDDKCQYKMGQIEDDNRKLRQCGSGKYCLCFVEYNNSYYNWGKECTKLGGCEKRSRPSWLDTDYKYKEGSYVMGRYYYNCSENCKTPKTTLKHLCNDFFEEKEAIKTLECQGLWTEPEGEEINFYWAARTPLCTLIENGCMDRYMLWIAADYNTDFSFTMESYEREGTHYVRKKSGGLE